ncbi:MAG: hypothetical protein ABI597_09760 [Gammaproteobacteria bacterium]
MSILTNSTSIALWHDIINDAEKSCAVKLKEEIECYLVFLLMRYTNKPELTKQIIALEFLEGAMLTPHQRALALQDVGDKCLLFAGLFPSIAEKRLVRLSYFINLGQASYVRISQKNNDLYELLSKQFVSLMDILQSIRQYTKNYPDLLPLQAYELWNDTGSQRALKILKQYTHHPESVPILVQVKDPNLFNK